jgi:hypothetical protein
MARRRNPNGENLAAVLAGSWRPAFSIPRLSSSELAEVVPSLLETGAGSLAWWRLRSSALRTSAAARSLHQAYRKHTLEAVAHEKRLQRLSALMQAAGLDPILIKGWATARLYPQAGLRPYGDIDLCVPPEYLGRAAAVLETAGGSCGEVDLHGSVPDLADRTWNEMLRRSQLAAVGDARVRVLSQEDHLRLLCLHQVRHGMWRPLWLCDVGAALEAAPDNFDWDYCLSGNAKWSRWVLAVVGLAQRLLGADVRPTRIAQRAADAVPPWMVETVLWRWESGRDRKPFAHYLRHPLAALSAVLHDGLNPIKAGYRLGVCPQRRSLMLPVQLAAFLARSVEIPRRAQRLGRKLLRQPARSFVLHRDQLL